MITTSNNIDVFFETEITAELENIDKIDEKVATVLTLSKLKRITFVIRLLLREALLNAVLHGSKRNAKNKIKFKLFVEDSYVCLKVVDAGKGFNWHQQLLDSFKAVQGDVISKIGGRGLFLMKAYADEITYNQRGNSLLLKKSINL